MNSMTVNVGEINSKYGYIGDFTINIRTITIVMGLFGAIIFGIIVDKTKKFKLCLIICLIGSIIGFLCQFLFF